MALKDLISSVDAGISVKVTLDSGRIAVDSDKITPSPTVDPRSAPPAPHDPKE